MRAKLVVALAFSALAALPPVAGAAVPPDFIGISPQSAPDDADYELMQEAGLKSLRMPLPWPQVEPVSPLYRAPDWSGFDLAVGLAARHGMTVMPFVASSPGWIASESRSEPKYGWQLEAWASFLRAAVDRYGAGGSFWRENPELPYRPVRNWEIWNEENIVTFGRAEPERFAPLLRVSGRTVHSADPEAKVILGGLFGRPLQIPPNISSGEYLNRIYRARRVKQYFDGVALHPYVARVGAMRKQILNLRRIMRLHHDAGTPIYVTELGWGSDSFESRWERGLWGQAEALEEAFSMLAGHRLTWRIGGVWWFSWADAKGACQFCDSAGLLTEGREAKPSWYTFNAWTGGNADIVPRASFGG
jgi:polysaccharide biosynthesis protein PslG